MLRGNSFNFVVPITSPPASIDQGLISPDPFYMTLFILDFFCNITTQTNLIAVVRTTKLKGREKMKTGCLSN